MTTISRYSNTEASKAESDPGNTPSSTIVIGNYTYMVYKASLYTPGCADIGGGTPESGPNQDQNILNEDQDITNQLLSDFKTLQAN
jgi:hypothetical protein